MNCVYTLKLNFKLGDLEITVHPVVIKNEREMILLDYRYPQFLPHIEKSMEDKGLDMKDLTKIIITHHDHDHMGALKEIKDKYPSVEVFCSETEAPYITGKKKSLRLTQAEALHDALPEDQKEESQNFQNFIAAVQKVDQVTAITCGEFSPACGGIEIIDTKGHTPGHISIYLPREKILIAGDVMVVEDDQLCIAVLRFALNMEDILQSIKNLLNYDIEKIICYHGGEYTHDIKTSLEKIVNQ